MLPVVFPAPVPGSRRGDKPALRTLSPHPHLPSPGWPLEGSRERPDLLLPPPQHPNCPPKSSCPCTLCLSVSVSLAPPHPSWSSHKPGSGPLHPQLPQFTSWSVPSSLPFSPSLLPVRSASCLPSHTPSSRGGQAFATGLLAALPKCLEAEGVFGGQCMCVLVGSISTCLG